MVLKRFAPAAAAAMFVLCGVPAAAQEAAPAATAEAAPAVDAPCCAVAALTPIEIEIGEDLSSKSSKTRDSFRFTLAEPLMSGDQLVAPAGTPASARSSTPPRQASAARAGSSFWPPATWRSATPKFRCAA